MNKIYSVKSYYSFINQGGSVCSYAPAHMEDSMSRESDSFMWLVLKNKLNTWDLLIKKIEASTLFCPLCSNNPKNIKHLLLGPGYHLLCKEWSSLARYIGFSFCRGISLKKL